MLNIGLIGMGVISRYYVAALSSLDNCQITAVCDLDTAQMNEQRARGVTCYSDYHDLLADPTVQGVVINLPNNLHFQACMDALNAGKHICCEKPLTLDLHKAKELTVTARHLKLTLLTAFHRRYNHHLIAAKASGVFDDAVAYIAHYDEKIEEHAGTDTWYLNSTACGGGCIADNGPNIFDTLSFLLGRLELTNIRVRTNAEGLDVGAEIRLRTIVGKQVIALLSWDYPRGECKDVIAIHSDGNSTRVDLLKDSVGFKTSLYHEYKGVLNHFVQAVKSGTEFGDDGVDAVRLVTDCYTAYRAQIVRPQKYPLIGRLIKTLHHTSTDRGMQLIKFTSRGVRAGEIHELVSTDQKIMPIAGERVDRVGFIGFMEAVNAGIVEVGDTLRIGEFVVGTVIGFDECHFPNHYNILIKSEHLITADDIPVATPGMALCFEDKRS